MQPHLVELRRRVLASMVWFILSFIGCFYYSQSLLTWLIHPVLIHLTHPGEGVISTQLIAPLLTPLQLAFDAAWCCTLPLMLFHAWRFISPGLYQQERKLFAGVLFASVLLFVSGVAFCFYGVLPNLFYLITQSRPVGVVLLPDMTTSVHFILYFLLLFGVCFQLPLLCAVLVYTRWVPVSLLKQIRPYVIVAAFIIGMLLTPPDVISQVLLALPLCVLYELGIILGVLIDKIQAD
jgi:sec-independent protein translocase protein TatC